VRPLHIPSVIRPERRTYAVVSWTDELLCGGYKWVYQFEAPCIPTQWTGEHEQWSKCPGAMSRRAVNSVAPLRPSSAGWLPTRIGRLFARVWRRHPVTIRKVSFMVRSLWRVWALRHKTGSQYSVVEWARVAVCNVVAPAPQPEPANCLKSATRDANFLRSESRCRGYLSDLFDASPRYLGLEQKGRFSVLWLSFTTV